MYKTIFTAIITFYFSLSVSGQDTVNYSKGELIVKMDGRVLTLENSQIKRSYQWNSGHLISHSLLDKISGQEWLASDGKPAFSFPGSGVQKAAKLEVVPVSATSVQPFHLQIISYVSLGTLEVKRVFRLYPSCPAIACDYYIRGQSDMIDDALLIPERLTQNIENADDLNEHRNDVMLDRITLPGKHWQLRSVQFSDITDRNNNLVQETSTLSYVYETRMSGNLLFVKNPAIDRGIFILKESPSSHSQINYNGYDFLAEGGTFQVTGAGISTSDLDTILWTRCYGVVVGVTHGGEYGEQAALKTYQRNMRKHAPNRDNMVLMNTWGDRNRDRMIQEKFILQELEAAARLGISHFQIDDGWQTGRSSNSAFGGSLTKIWDNPNYWLPDSLKFPHGLDSITKRGKELHMEIALWFNPSKDMSYANWKKDAGALIHLYRRYGIKMFKIDGVEIPDKKAEVNLRKMLDSVQSVSKGEVVFNLDVTAGKRMGYHYFNEYGNIFLENRYTDWGNYYPHWTLRNLWMLSKYIPSSNLQIEFLNPYRNSDKYDKADVLAPSAVPFEYLFAVTMAAQPLAWMEGTGLPEQAFSLSPIVLKYRSLQQDIHAGQVFPIGEEPSGFSWTGFQSQLSDRGYFLVYREYNEHEKYRLKTYLKEGTGLRIDALLGSGTSFTTVVGKGGYVEFSLPEKYTYALYAYQIISQDNFVPY